MATFKAGTERDGKPVLVNIDLVQTIRWDGEAKCSQLRFGSELTVYITERPEVFLQQSQPRPPR